MFICLFKCVFNDLSYYFFKQKHLNVFVSFSI